MNLKKTYHTIEGKECNILQLVKNEPEWAANTIQGYEKKIKPTTEKINHLAGLFYKAHGCSVKEGYRFYSASHPQERNMWNLAVTAYKVIEQI